MVGRPPPRARSKRRSEPFLFCTERMLAESGEPFLFCTERMLAESAETGVSRLSLLRCELKECAFRADFLPFSKM
jgi:hypothetical protein